MRRVWIYRSQCTRRRQPVSEAKGPKGRTVDEIEKGGVASSVQHAWQAMVSQLDSHAGAIQQME